MNICLSWNFYWTGTPGDFGHMKQNDNSGFVGTSSSRERQHIHRHTYTHKLLTIAEKNVYLSV